MSFIEDGTGDGYSLKIDASHRAKIEGVTKGIEQASTERADSYNVNTGLVTITSVDEQGLIYLKNNETSDLHITQVILILGPSTGGVTTDTTRVKFIKNATTGTLISEATNVDTNSNRNFGSSKTLSVDAYKGDGSATVTNGSVHIESLISPPNRVVFSIEMILTKGDTISVTVEAPDSNTNMKAMCAIVCHLADPDA